MDPLSDVLNVVRLTGAFFYLVEASAPWSVRAVGAKELAPRILPESEHLISYHVMTSGGCWGGLDADRFFTGRVVLHVAREGDATAGLIDRIADAVDPSRRQGNAGAGPSRLHRERPTNARRRADH